MNENGEQDEQDLSSHVMSHYFEVNGGRAMEDHVGNEGANKHSYFLRAKPKTHRYEVMMNKEGASSSPARSKSGHFDEYSASSEEEDLANCLVMLSNKPHDDENKGKQLVEKGMFQCKACKKIFNSHQALGGHRASHKKVKGCFAAKLDIGDDEQDSVQEEQHDPVIPAGSQPTRSAPTGKRPKMHECSVCRRVFSSGQALGGHKRCHWLTTSSDNAFIPSFQDFQYGHPNNQQQQQQQLCKEPMLITNPPHHHQQQQQQQDHHHQLDLNLNLLPDVNNTSRFEASTRLYLQQQKIPNTEKKNDDDDDNNDQTGCDQVNKIRKLSDLRDVNYDGGWLQMGIASTADIMY